MLNYLKLCHASIMDQGINVEHIVIDGGSKDGTVDWLKTQKDIIWISEKDNGMYDAINKGLKLATGDIIAYLNCDEQYLPGTLNKIQKFFYQYPDIDIVFGSALIVDNRGYLLSYRKAYKLRYSYIRSSFLYNLSCTMFFRRKLIDEGNFFDYNLRDVGDADFVLKALKNGYNFSIINDYLSVFIWTGKNMSLGENAKKERDILEIRYGKFNSFVKLLLNILRYIEKFISGAYFQKWPLNYSIYVNEDKTRKDFTVDYATFKWPKKRRLFYELENL